MYAEGYYLQNHTLEIKLKTNTDGWLDYNTNQTDKDLKHQIQSNNNFECQMLVPSEKSMFGVISDFDDIILFTGVTSRLK